MQEDHASMGGMSVHKALKVIDNTEAIVGIELLCACQVTNISNCYHHLVGGVKTFFLLFHRLWSFDVLMDLKLLHLLKKFITPLGKK